MNNRRADELNCCSLGPRPPHHLQREDDSRRTQSEMASSLFKLCDGRLARAYRRRRCRLSSMPSFSLSPHQT